MSTPIARTWWYLHRNPITEDVIPVTQSFLYDQQTGEWQLPSGQPVLPHMIEGTDFYDTYDEALAALLRREWTEGDDDGDSDEDMR